MMSRHAEILERHELTLIRNLQDTEFKTVDLVEGPAGEKSVLKYCKLDCPSLALEKDVLEAVNMQSTDYLIFPDLIAHSDDYLLMSYVERERQTRKTIRKRDWTEQDVEVLSRGLLEFQGLTIPAQSYTLKQKIMGFLYPTIKMFLSLPALLKRRPIGLGAIIKCALLAVRYGLRRPWLRYVTTHYDMTTLNCAFSSENKLSILDLELGYAGGDPLFDICYFLTIPPKSLRDWTFQSRVLRHFLNETSRQTSLTFRLRYILLLCSIGRLLHFRDGSKKQRAYKASIDLLLDRNKFENWLGDVMSGSHS